MINTSRSMRVALLVSLALVPTSVNAHYAIAWGIGVGSCGDYTKAHSDHYTSVAAALSGAQDAWIQGYISAVNAYREDLAGSDITRGTDVNGVDAWIANYCAQHPIDPIFKASQELIKELVGRQRQP